MRFHHVAATVFGLVAIGHAVRALRHLPFQVGAFAVPEWASWVGVAVAGALSVWGFRSRG